MHSRYPWSRGGRVAWLLGCLTLTAPGMATASGAQGPGAPGIAGPVAGTPMLALGNFDLTKQHYVVQEFFLSGQAASYQPVGALNGDGRWTVKTGGTAPFTTRMVVVRPADPRKFNGTVVVEWLNVSAGTDGAPDWSYTHRALLRDGFAYVGVSAQKAGIAGGGILGIPGVLPIKVADPVRYARLDHPGDAYAYDIFTQAGRAVRDGSAGLLGPLHPIHVIATGESQSAGYLTTYVNAVAPIAHTFDGYLIHSRFGGAAPLDGVYVPSSHAQQAGIHIRDDFDKPVLIFISETDLMTPRVGYLSARQPDSPLLRTWEIAGTAHADTYTLAGAALDSGFEPISVLAESFTPTDTIMGMKLGGLMNAAPQHHYVMMAALSALNRWVVSGALPPHGPRLAVDEGTAPPELVKDAVGNATGGIRSPWMDVPTAVLSGLGQSAHGMAFLFGSTKPFDAATLARLYPAGHKEYMEKFNVALRAAIKAGFIEQADAAEITALAAARFPRN